MVAISLAASLFIGGCGGVGGSGSSGLSERVAIRTALTTESCAPSTAVDFCPTDTADVLPSGEEIYTPIDAGATAECFELGSDDLLCEFAFTFEPANFDDSTEFILAARPYDSDDPWLVGSESDLFGETESGDPLASAEAPIDPLLFGEEPVQLAFATLQPQSGALGAAEPLPDEVGELADLGTALVFVPQPLRTTFSQLPDEDLTIEAALAQRECVDAGVFFACPTGEPFPPSELEPSFGFPLFFFDTEVDVADSQPFDCVVDGPDTCSFTLHFRIDGLIEYYYQAAARVMDGESPGLWRIAAEVTDSEEDPEVPREIAVPVSITLPAQTPVDDPGFVLPVQIALMPDPIVLDPAPVVDILSLSVGFEAFVTDTMDVKVVGGSALRAPASAGSVAPAPPLRRHRSGRISPKRFISGAQWGKR